jgi:hypothetical protein
VSTTKLVADAKFPHVAHTQHGHSLLGYSFDHGLFLDLLLARERQLAFPLSIAALQPSPTRLHITTELFEFHFATQ